MFENLGISSLEIVSEKFKSMQKYLRISIVHFISALHSLILVILENNGTLFKEIRIVLFKLGIFQLEICYKTGNFETGKNK